MEFKAEDLHGSQSVALSDKHVIYLNLIGIYFEMITFL